MRAVRRTTTPGTPARLERPSSRASPAEGRGERRGTATRARRGRDAGATRGGCAGAAEGRRGGGRREGRRCGGAVLMRWCGARGRGADAVNAAEGRRGGGNGAGHSGGRRGKGRMEQARPRRCGEGTASMRNDAVHAERWRGEETARRRDGAAKRRRGEETARRRDGAAKRRRGGEMGAGRTSAQGATKEGSRAALPTALARASLVRYISSIHGRSREGFHWDNTIPSKLSVLAIGAPVSERGRQRSRPRSWSSRFRRVGAAGVLAPADLG
jgi:hypothetical protein